MAAVLPSSADVVPLPAARSRGYWSSVLLRLRRDPVAVGAAALVKHALLRPLDLRFRIQ